MGLSITGIGFNLILRGKVFQCHSFFKITSYAIFWFIFTQPSAQRTICQSEPTCFWSIELLHHAYSIPASFEASTAKIHSRRHFRFSYRRLIFLYVCNYVIKSCQIWLKLKICVQQDVWPCWKHSIRLMASFT